jgi:hypothetical protein
MCGVSSRAPPYLVDATPITQRVIEGGPERIADEAERIDKVALTGSIGPDEKRQGSQRNVACRDAAVVPQHDASDERSITWFHSRDS